MAKAATVYDVARLAGVSIATVSDTFRRPDRVRRHPRGREGGGGEPLELTRRLRTSSPGRHSYIDPDGAELHGLGRLATVLAGGQRTSMCRAPATRQAIPIAAHAACHTMRGINVRDARRWASLPSPRLNAIVE